MNIEVPRGVRSIHFEEGQHVTAGVALAGLVQDLSGGDSRAANRSVAPSRR